MSSFDKARELIREFKGDTYVYGSGVLGEVGRMAAEQGQRAVLVRSTYPGTDAVVARVTDSLAAAGVEVVGEIAGARPNTPREDVLRIATALKMLNPDVIVGMGAGSTIDATKAAEVLHTLGGPIDHYFGLGKVTEKASEMGKTLTPIVAVQTASSSGAHLTKYSNITDMSTGQKKVIIDLAIVPNRAVYDFDLSKSMSPAFTADGAFDGVAHALEALYDSVGKPYHNKMMVVAHEVIDLVVRYVEKAIETPNDTEARAALGLATDLGGYSIMIGGTNGGHLTSFSLVDILSHGRACAIMNPYYTVFFAPRIEQPLRMVGNVFKEAGLTGSDIDNLEGRELGVAVAQAMIDLSKRIGFPATLGEIEGFTDEHIGRALTAAKDPQLKIKLDNMPIPLSAETVDEYMGPILLAAKDGDLSKIKNIP